jgi:hypothetical protein
MPQPATTITSQLSNRAKQIHKAEYSVEVIRDILENEFWKYCDQKCLCHNLR